MYKANLSPIPRAKAKPAALFSEKPKDVKKKHYHLVSKSIDVGIKDQGYRGTCASFAAVRAMEILLRQHYVDHVLSEQYFYWASRSDCQQIPCNRGGSWVSYGFDHSKASRQMDIPKVSACPYNPQSQANNETQIPLAPGCREKGVAKVNEYMAISSFESLEAALLANVPVIFGASLSDNFYTNTGLVTQEAAVGAMPKDSHAPGHALVFVGLVRLPKEMHAKEGKSCFVVANSWGAGWGRGGYACLTENWLQKHILPGLDFIAVKTLEI